MWGGSGQLDIKRQPLRSLGGNDRWRFERSKDGGAVRDLGQIAFELNYAVRFPVIKVDICDQNMSGLCNTFGMSTRLFRIGLEQKLKREEVFRQKPDNPSGRRAFGAERLSNLFRRVKSSAV